MKPNGPIRLLIIPSWYPPNGGAFFRVHSLSLAQAGAEVSLIALPFISMGKHGFVRWFRGGHLQFHKEGSFVESVHACRVLPFMDRPNAINWVRETHRLAARWLHRFGPVDLVVAHSAIWAGLAAARLKKTHGTPFVITEHRSRFVSKDPMACNLFRPWHEPLLKEALQAADHIVTVSDSLQARIIELVPGSRHKISSIPNMVDTDFFIPASRPPALHPFRFFSLAHLEKAKGMDVLIDAMQLLVHQEKKDVSLVVGGDGSVRGPLERQVKACDLEQRVHFTGHLSHEEVRGHMQAAHIFVLPSRFEAFGVVCIEALSCGIPVVATLSGGPNHILKPGMGSLVPPNDPLSLARAMADMMLNYQRYQTDTIRSYAIKHFGKQSIANISLDLYRQLIKQSGP